MGNRYILTVICPGCRFRDDDVYYAPTCGFNDWTCPKCDCVVELAKYTGITYEDASNLDKIEKTISDIMDGKEK